MPLPELSQGIPIPVPTSERGGYLFLVFEAMATRDGEGSHPSISMIRLPSGYGLRIARINLDVICALSTATSARSYSRISGQISDEATK